MRRTKELLLSYIPMADFLAEINGPQAEALIHNIADPARSIIYITRQNITGRCIGGPLTDYACDLIKDGFYRQNDYIVNYKGRSPHQGKTLRSSTFFIKDRERLVGLLCLNVDITEQVEALEKLDRALLVDARENVPPPPAEIFNLSVEELVQQTVLQFWDKDKELMPAQVRRMIVRRLHEQDVFRVKKTIPLVAQAIEVSEQTIYRYINELTKGGKENDTKN